MGYGNVTEVGADILHFDALADEVEAEMLEEDPELRDQDVLDFARSIIDEMTTGFDEETGWETLADDLRGLDDSGGMIHESYFREYAEQALSDIGDVPDWVMPYVDTEQWANDYRSDFTSMETNQGTYYYL
jgi:hypothetical protein